MDPILTSTLINSGMNFLGGLFGGEEGPTGYTGSASPQNYMSILTQLLGSEYKRMNSQRGQAPQLRSSYLPDPTTGKLEGAPSGIPNGAGPITDLSFMDRLMPSSAKRRGIPSSDENDFPSQPTSKQASIINRRRSR